MSDNNTSRTKFALLAGILAFGLLAASFAGSQMLNKAVAQSGSEEGKTVTAMDNATTSGITAAPFYHGYVGQSTVSTSGTATTKVQPDKFSVTVSVETNGTTAAEAASRNADLMGQVIAALKELGITEDQISTSNYNVYPVYEYKALPDFCAYTSIIPPPPECQSNNVITGYKATNSATVTLDVDGDVNASEVIDAAIGAGANNVNGVYFFVSQEMQQEVRDSLIKEAIDNARHRADIAASALGLTVSGVQSLSLNDVYFPYFGRAFDSAGSSSGVPTPVLPGEQEVSTSVSAVFYFSGGEMSSSSSGNSTSPSGMTASQNNQDCVNPPGGPMIC